MDYMNPNNMPPMVSPAAAPNVMPNVMPHVSVFENKNITENIYMYPHTKPAVHHPRTDVAIILVLFILLVIILRGFHYHVKC